MRFSDALSPDLAPVALPAHAAEAWRRRRARNAPKAGRVELAPAGVE